MAHFEKFKKSETRAVLQHDAREYTEKRDNIDKSKTVLNYNLAPAHDPWQFVKDKIAMSKESGARFNARSVSCVSCVITLPKDFKGDSRLFFETAKKHLDSVFGVENCISAWVHLDEPKAQPHLHYKATPCILDKESGVLSFNAKKLITRSFLKSYHSKLSAELEKVFGYKVNILNGATTEGNLTVPQLKKQQEKYEALVKEYDDLIDEYNDLIDDYNSLSDQHDELRKKVVSLKNKLDEIRRENSLLADRVLGDDSEFER